MSSLTLATSILKNPILKKTSLNAINNSVLKNCFFYSTTTEDGPKLKIPNLQSKDISKNEENIENKEVTDNEPQLKTEQVNTNTTDTNNPADNDVDDNDNDSIPLKKKQNKKYNSGDNRKYYLISAIGLVIPLFYVIKKRRRNLNDYNSSDVRRVKKVQRSYNSEMRQEMPTYLYSLQNDLVHIIEEMDPKLTLNRNNWNQRSKHSTGGGTTCSFENGKIFEKAAVQVNVESGSLTPFQVIELLASKPSAQIISKSLNDKFTFYKASLSSVLYPQNPHVPTAILDLAYNEIKNQSTGKTYWWFSGGNDLLDTSLYLTKQEDILSSTVAPLSTSTSPGKGDELLQEYFQKYFKEELDNINPDYYDQFVMHGKQSTYLSHRDELRGVGGLYFNELNDDQPQNILNSVIQCFAQKTFEFYKPVLEKRNKLSWTVADKEKQAIKNSRLVEFELVSKLSSKVDDSSVRNIDKALPILPLNVSWKKSKNELIVNENDN